MRLLVVVAIIAITTTTQLTLPEYKCKATALLLNRPFSYILSEARLIIQGTFSYLNMYIYSLRRVYVGIHQRYSL